jgi:hypothetical protein
LLYRELYRGVITWNRTRKRDGWGQKRMTARPAGEWLRVEAPELRVVPDELWQAAHSRLESARAFYLRGTNGQLWGRPREAESKYLLTSLVRCASCGSGLCARSRQHGRSRAFFYACQGYHKRGQTVCANHLEIRMEDLDAAVLELVADEVLDPSVIEDAMAQALAILAPERTNDDLGRLRRELSRVEAELLRLSEAIARGGDLTSLVEAVQSRQGRREALQGDIQALEARSTGVNPDVVAARLRGLAREWRSVLGRHVVQGRQILRQVLDGPLQVTPDLERRRVRLEGAATLSKLLEKVTDLPTSMASSVRESSNTAPGAKRDVPPLRVIVPPLRELAAQLGLMRDAAGVSPANPASHSRSLPTLLRKPLPRLDTNRDPNTLPRRTRLA